MTTKYEIEEKDLVQEEFDKQKEKIKINNDGISLAGVIGEPIFSPTLSQLYGTIPEPGTATEIRIEPRFRIYEESYILDEPINYDTIISQIPF